MRYHTVIVQPFFLRSPSLFSILSTSNPVARSSYINFYGILSFQMTHENNYFIRQVLHFSHLDLLPYSTRHTSLVPLIDLGQDAI